MTAYYNEIDEYAAQWLRNLIAKGLIPAGDVDTRSIEDVKPDDLRGYTQAHFFAGIGGWPIALKLAGWPDDRPVWTGSCPCQPFSAAGEGKAADDERHLWPAWLPLITERRPPVVFGEQVEAAIGWGWLDAVFADLEPQGYACGFAVLPACSVGAPHKRNRVWFVADHQDHHGRLSDRQERRQNPQFVGRGETGGRMDHAPGGGCEPRKGDARIRSADDGETDAAAQQRPDGSSRLMADAPDADRRPGERGTETGAGPNRERGRRSASGGAHGDLADTSGRGFGKLGDEAQPGSGGHLDRGLGAGELGDAERSGSQGHLRPFDMGLHRGEESGRSVAETGLSGGFWTGAEWLPCTDGRARPIEPGSFPLAHGVQRRTSKLRAYGNAIVPQVAAEFIGAYLEA